ncbi:hypothetical protein BD779DRAFT_1682543 [Infundibulicybe gibba]|nr:hypothetical protein BD779DRAFT_1682543 [Infundibulicybe gibba]
MLGDIMDKGVLGNYNTMTNEKIHHILKRHSHERTNFRNVETQLANIDQHVSASKVIREHIDHLDESLHGCGEGLNGYIYQDPGEGTDHEDEPDEDNELGNFGRVNLGAGQAARSAGTIDSSREFDPFDLTFPNFIQKLSKYLNSEYEHLGIQRPGNRAITVDPKNMVTEYRYLKVYFETVVDWKMDINRLRCSPKFHSNPRYDSVLTHNAGGDPIFMRLQFIFTYQVGDQVLPLALVQPYAYLSPSRRDKDLEFIQFSLKTNSTFIPVRSIVRGVLIAPTFSNPNHYHLVDVVDPDMFLRTRTLFPSRFPNWDSPLEDDEIQDASDGPGSDSDDLGVDIDDIDWDLGLADMSSVSDTSSQESGSESEP